MPVLINEVVAEVETVIPEIQSEPTEQRMPVEKTEFELLYTLSLLEMRRQRLSVD